MPSVTRWIHAVGAADRLDADRVEKGPKLMSEMTLASDPTIDWADWLHRWDRQQEGYLPDREERFTAMLDVIDLQLRPDFLALDLACGPGAIAQRLLERFPDARTIALDTDPVLLALGEGALGGMGGRLTWMKD